MHCPTGNMLASRRVQHVGSTALCGRSPILPRAAVLQGPKAVNLTLCRASEKADDQRNPVAAVAAAGVAAGLLLLSGSPAYANTVFQGPARIVDGDTLYIGKDKIRLYGVDAPEKTQSCNDSKGQPYACGVVSLEALKERVGSRTVRCEVKTKDQYGRNVAACSISPDMPFQQSEDMGTFLVSNGYAVAYRAYGKEYIPIEDQAHGSRKGIWAGNFTEPALWRKQQKAESLNASLASSNLNSMMPAQPAVSSVGAGTGGRPSYAAVAAGGEQRQGSPPPTDCNGPIIKGNINSKGQKIYHTVSSGQYQRVIIEENKGEKYFCTEQEALAAGWVAAKK